MNPWALLAAVAMNVASVGAAFVFGQQVATDHEQAKQAAREAAIRETREAAQQGAAAAIAQLKPRNVTIRQEVQREIQTNTVYRDCRVPVAGVRGANEALTGRPQPAGGGELPRPGADAAGR